MTTFREDIPEQDDPILQSGWEEDLELMLGSDANWLGSPKLSELRQWFFSDSELQGSLRFYLQLGYPNDGPSNEDKKVNKLREHVLTLESTIL